MRFALLLALLLASAARLPAPVAASSLSSIDGFASPASQPLPIAVRHGDHGDEEQEQAEEHIDGQKQAEEHIDSHQGHDGDDHHDMIVDQADDNNSSSKAPDTQSSASQGHGGGGHSHSHSHSHEAPKFELDEDSILYWHGPTPLSYLEYDFAYGLADLPASFPQVYQSADGGDVKEGTDEWKWAQFIDRHRSTGGHAGLMVAHVLGMMLAYFVVLPLGIMLRIAHSALSLPCSLLFLALTFISSLLAATYRGLTPDLYPSAFHTKLGWFTFWLGLGCTGYDALQAVLRTLRWWKATKGRQGETVWQRLRRGLRGDSLRLDASASASAYASLDEEELLADAGDAEEIDDEKLVVDDAPASRRDAHDNAVDPSPAHVSVEDLLDSASYSDSSATRAPAPDAQRRRPHTREHSVHFSPDPPSHDRSDGSDHTLHENDDATLARSSFSRIKAWRHSKKDSNAFSPDGHHRTPLRISTSPGTCSPAATHSPPLSAATTLVHTPTTAFGGAGAGSRTRSPPLRRHHPRAGTKSASPLHKRVSTTLKFTHIFLTRLLVVLGFVAAATGISDYAGFCRGSWTNSCLAHGIKGGIFFGYGILTFGRYLGCWAELGWAWNKRPSHTEGGWRAQAPSAEWVECFFIFLYGATNTWMERFGAQPGSAYTVKEVQHISIAVMFWWAGLMGLLLETRAIRNLLAWPVALRHPSAVPARRLPSTASEAEQQSGIVDAQKQPPSYSGSFNPFPAIVVGVTGIAMSAHHQDYQYAVEVHKLWGMLLGGFGVFRCMTYFFLWLRPPTSVLPSRPPTEVLAAFGLTGGGLVFMLSVEQITFASMRSGYDDLMATLNVTVAVVSVVFCWIFILLAIKGYMTRRAHMSAEAEEEAAAVRHRAASLHRPVRGASSASARGSGAADAAHAQADETLFEAGEHYVLDDDDDVGDQGMRERREGTIAV